MEHWDVDPGKVTREWEEVFLTRYELREAIAAYLQNREYPIKNADHISSVRRIHQWGPRKEAYKRGMRWSVLVSVDVPCVHCQWPPKPVLSDGSDVA